MGHLLTTKKIPALSGDEMEALCSHLFALRDRDQRLAIAEIAYHNHDDSQALNIKQCLHGQMMLTEPGGNCLNDNNTVVVEIASS